MSNNGLLDWNALKMEVVLPYETLAGIYKYLRHYNTADQQRKLHFGLQQ
jgi:hypothetical protein